MRLREFLSGIGLMFIALVTARASAPTVLGDDCRPDFADGAPSVVEGRTSVAAPTAPSPLIAQDKLLGSAYYDTVSILSSNNRCSDFFGGPDSIDAFNDLVSRIRRDVLTASIGMRMSGSTTNIHDARTKKEYRLFAKVTINSHGPFYRRKAGLWEPNVPKVGSFEPNTKQARVLMLLHELGHVVKGSDGKWVLPDDGRDEELSRANSDKVEDECERQIHGLGKVATITDLGKYKRPENQPVSVKTGDGTRP